MLPGFLNNRTKSCSVEQLKAICCQKKQMPSLFNVLLFLLLFSKHKKSVASSRDACYFGNTEYFHKFLITVYSMFCSQIFLSRKSVKRDKVPYVSKIDLGPTTSSFHPQALVLARSKNYFVLLLVGFSVFLK